MQTGGKVFIPVNGTAGTWKNKPDINTDVDKYFELLDGAIRTKNKAHVYTIHTKNITTESGISQPSFITERTNMGGLSAASIILTYRNNTWEFVKAVYRGQTDPDTDPTIKEIFDKITGGYTGRSMSYVDARPDGIYGKDGKKLVTIQNPIDATEFKKRIIDHILSMSD
jgi:hypothetical protein